MVDRLQAPKADGEWAYQRILEILEGEVPITLIETLRGGGIFVEPIFDKDFPAGRVLHLNPNERSVHVGREMQDLTPATAMELYGSLLRGAFEAHPKIVTVGLDHLPPELVPFAVEGIVVALMEPHDFKTDPKAYRGPKEIELRFAPGKALAALEFVMKGIERARYRNLQRFLGHLDPVTLNPESYRDLVYRLVRDRHGVEVMEPVSYESLGLLSAVARGSMYNGYIVAFRVDPASGPTSKVAIRVGKGVTFDSGGVMDKGEHMPGMKLDMMGSAAVLAAGLYFLVHPDELLQSTIYVLGLAENRDGPGAYVPDEILVSHKGLTVENTHPDAEGRLLLADAMGWSVEQPKPTEEIVSILTIATLTGAAWMALSTPYTALFLKGDDQNELGRLRKVGDDCADPIWPLPASHPHYAKQMESKVADLRNTGKEKPGGAPQAAAFLAHFLPDDYAGEFVHLDIAGSVDIDMAGTPSTAKGLPQDAGVAFLIALDRVR